MPKVKGEERDISELGVGAPNLGKSILRTST